MWQRMATWCLLTALAAFTPAVFGANQSIVAIPSFTTPPSNWGALTETFLYGEDAARAARGLSGFVYTWTTPLTSGNLTHTIPALDAFGADGHVIQQSATAATYVATRRTFLLADPSDTGTPTITGGTGCTFKDRIGSGGTPSGAHLIRIECAAASTDPDIPTNMILLAYVDTGTNSAITTVARRANRFAVRPSRLNLGHDVSEYGAVCDNVADDTPGIVAALTAALNVTTHNFSRVSFPLNGRCRVSSVLTINTAQRGMIEGNGADITWTGNATTPMWLFQDTQHMRIENMHIISSTAVPLLTGIQSENSVEAVLAPSSLQMQNIVIQGTNGGVEVGYRAAQGAGGDANNDRSYLYKVYVHNYSLAAFRIEHSQSKAHNFEESACAGGATGQYCVYVVNGSFNWHGGGGGNNEISDFSVQNTNDPTAIRDGLFEQSRAFLVTGGPSSGSGSFSVTGNSWRLASAGQLAANGRIISFQFRTLFLAHNYFDTSNPAAAGAFFLNGGNNGSYTFINNTFITTLADPFTAEKPTVSLANIIDVVGDSSLAAYTHDGLKRIEGVSSTGVRANNMRGTKLLDGTTPTTVTFATDGTGVNEVNATYFVQVTCGENETSAWVTAKATTGFVINTSGPHTSNCDWLLTR